MRHPRCIALSAAGVRCPRNAGKRSGNIYVCRRHSTMWTMLLIDDGYSPGTRSMLAFSRWRTAREGQRLIDAMHRTVAA